MVDKDGIEPSTSELSAPRSNRLSYSSIWSEELDSNQRCFYVTDLQSAPFAAWVSSDIFWCAIRGSNSGLRH